jgi:hypothetical protein
MRGFAIVVQREGDYAGRRIHCCWRSCCYNLSRRCACEDNQSALIPLELPICGYCNFCGYERIAQGGVENGGRGCISRRWLSPQIGIWGRCNAKGTHPFGHNIARYVQRREGGTRGRHGLGRNRRGTVFPRDWRQLLLSLLFSQAFATGSHICSKLVRSSGKVLNARAKLPK